MKNPFKEQAEYHKKEAKKWSTISKVVGIILFILILLSMSCKEPFTYEIYSVSIDGNKYVEYKYKGDNDECITSDILIDTTKTKILKRIK